jgi:hypothetical protein
VKACEPGLLAEVLPVRDAEPAPAAGPSQPGDADPRTGCRGGHICAHTLHDPDDLVAGHQGEVRGGQLPVGHVEIGTADPACADPHEDLSGVGLGDGHI